MQAARGRNQLDPDIQVSEGRIGNDFSAKRSLSLTPARPARACLCALLLIGAVVCFSGSAHGQKKSVVLCSVRDLPTEVSTEINELRVQEQLVVTSSYASAVIRVVNVSSKPITAMQLTLEYYGEDGERFGDATGSAIAKTIAEPQSFEILKRLTDGGPAYISNILQPGNAASVGLLGTFTTASCPARAKLAAALLWFSDGTSLDWSSPDARLDPQPDELNLSKLPGCLLQHDTRSLYLTLELDREGRVASVDQATGSAPQALTCDTSEIRKWTFRPAMQDGKAIVTTIPILLRVHDVKELPNDSWDRVSPREIPRPLVVVDALPPARGRSAWRVFFGGEPPNNTQAWGK